MDELPNINIAELLRALKKKAIPLQSEIGTFVAMEACAAISDRFVLVGTQDVWLDFQGNVSIKFDKPPVSSEDAARSVVDLLCELLLASAHGIPPLLLELIDAQPSGPRLTIAQLRDRLEASLVPLNRSASQRVLARLLREALREGERVSLNPPVAESFQALDSQFDTLMAERGTPQKKSLSGEISR